MAEEVEWRPSNALRLGGRRQAFNLHEHKTENHEEGVCFFCVCQPWKRREEGSDGFDALCYVYSEKLHN